MFTLAKFFGENICDSEPQLHHPTCLGHLGQLDMNRNDPVCVILPKVAKANRVDIIAMQSHTCFFAKNIANVN